MDDIKECHSVDFSGVTSVYTSKNLKSYLHNLTKKLSGIYILLTVLQKSVNP